MYLKKIKLKNFRAHKELEIDVKNMNIIIGKNDIGKSTILDALEVFFNSKPDLLDLNVGMDQNDSMEISCVFDIDYNKQIPLDSSSNSTTTLKQEFLLNKDGYLEILKVYDKKCKEKIYIIAKHPTNFEKSLITSKITDLKKIIADKGLDSSSIKLTTKKEIRQLIFDNTSLNFEDEYRIETDIKDSDIICIYSKLESFFPIYMLFRADRTNTDGDEEVLDSLKAITKTAVSEVETQFTTIKETVNKKIEEISKKTLEKLQMFDKDIANTLEHNISSRNLDTLFSFTFQCDDGIPFNKRGSGVKRLMLLSFFLAEAERKQPSSKTIIYAIEEPETSQHPDFQIKLIKSLIELSEIQDKQIIITTHTPEIVKMVDKENLIFLQKKDNKIQIQQASDIELKNLIETLGILPYVSYKGVIFVEGKTDIQFLKHLSMFDTFKNIIDLNNFTFIPLHGCGNVDKWIKEDYLEKSNVKCFYFKDSDNNITESFEKGNNVIKTVKKEIENYIPITVIEKTFNMVFDCNDKKNINNIDIAKILHEKYNIPLEEKHIKEKLQSNDIWTEIKEIDMQSDKLEFIDWFTKIKIFFEQ